MTKIIDCIPFYQNNTLFEIRIKTLENIVDCFIVCEATKTHNGEDKKLNFQLEKFLKITNKIKYIVIDDMPDKFSTEYKKFPLYNFQVDKLLDAIKDFDNDDIIIFSDEDEIPRPEKINLFDSGKFKYGIFLQNLYYYRFNILNTTEYNGTRWPGSRISKKKNINSFSQFRALKTKNAYPSFWKFWKETSIQLIENGGWHFSYLMSNQNIAKKINDSEHQEFNKKEFRSTIEIANRIKNLIDPFERGYILKKVNIDNTYPKEIFNNLEKYNQWILE